MIHPVERLYWYYDAGVSFTYVLGLLLVTAASISAITQMAMHFWLELGPIAVTVWTFVIGSILLVIGTLLDS